MEAGVECETLSCGLHGKKNKRSVSNIYIYIYIQIEGKNTETSKLNKIFLLLSFAGNHCDGWYILPTNMGYREEGAGFSSHVHSICPSHYHVMFRHVIRGGH